tara:strand:+ start:34 stop:204 length:171 start_codon:yes stop_codon:yes gene_type:complete
MVQNIIQKLIIKQQVAVLLQLLLLLLLVLLVVQDGGLTLIANVGFLRVILCVIASK